MLMNTTPLVLLTGLVLAAVAGFALSQERSAPSTPSKPSIASDAQAPATAGSAKAAVDLPVIGYIEKRDRTIIIKAGPKGPVYTVKAGNGKVLFENLSKEQLLTQAPELGEFLRTAVAGAPAPKANGRATVIVDASIGTSHGR